MMIASIVESNREFISALSILGGIRTPGSHRGPLNRRDQIDSVVFTCSGYRFRNFFLTFMSEDSRLKGCFLVFFCGFKAL